MNSYKKNYIQNVISVIVFMLSMATFSQNILISQGGTVNVSGGEIFYDAGGAAGNYTTTDYTITLCPSIPGEMVMLDFTTFKTAFNAFDEDALFIYDGTTATGNNIGKLMGDYTRKTSNGSNPYGVGRGTVNGAGPDIFKPTIFSATNSSGCLTLKFTRNSSTTYTGWAANVSTFKPAGLPGCNVDITASNASICSGGSSLLTATGNVATSTLNNNFNGSIGTGWVGSLAATITNTVCSAPSLDNSQYLWMQNAAFPRTLESATMDVSTGGTISFEYRQAKFNSDPTPCEAPDILSSGTTNEGVYLQYSTDNGATWITFKYIFSNSLYSNNASADSYNNGCGDYVTRWTKMTYPIPAGAQSANTKFRWIQPAGTSSSTDNWGLDNVIVASPKPSTLTITDLSNNSVIATTTNPSTSISVSPTTTRTYRATVTDGTTSCSKDITVTVNGGTPTTIAYSAASYLSSNVTQQNVVVTNGPVTGAYASLPAGLSLNTATGAFIPSTSTPGSYTVSVPTSCGTATATVVIASSSCASCATATCSVVNITTTTAALGQTGITTSLNTAADQLGNAPLTPGQNITVCVPVTVVAGSTILGFKQLSSSSPGGCGNPLEEVMTYQLTNAACGAVIAPNRTNASAVASGFNPEWDGLAAGNYVLCFTMNVTATAICTSVDLQGLGYYNVVPPPVPCQDYQIQMYSDDLLINPITKTAFACSDASVFLGPNTFSTTFNSGLPYNSVNINIVANSGNLNNLVVYRYNSANVLVETLAVPVGGVSNNYFLRPTGAYYSIDKTNLTSGNYTYTITDNISGAVLATGTWVVTAGAESLKTGLLLFQGTGSYSGPGVSNGFDPAPAGSVGDDYSDDRGIGVFNPQLAGVGSHTITYTWNNGLPAPNNCTLTRTMNVTVSGPSAPATTNVSICSGQTASLTATAVTGTVKWYDAATGGNLLFTGNPFTTPALTTTTSYWVSQTVGGCESSRTQVTVSMSAGVAPTYSSTVVNCAPGSINFSSVLPVGTTFDWISGPLGYVFPAGFQTALTTNTSLTALPAGTYCVDITSPNVAGGLVTQTLLTEDFETNAPNWTIDNSGGNNSFVINNVYAGGTCTIGGVPFTVPAVPNEGAWATAGPQSKYLHIKATTTCGFACAEGGAFPPANANFCSTISDQKFTLNTPINTVGKTNVTFNFYFICRSADVDDYGALEYSINGGTTWIQAGANLSGATTWTNRITTLPAWDNQASLLFRLRWRNDGSASSDPPLSVDQISITAQTVTVASCGTTVQECIVINPATTPTFNAITPICSGATLSALPTTSTNGISGTWSPALNNTATTTYTFTPTAGQCATTTTLTITVNPNITPTFNAVTPICSGGSLSALPTTSTNGISGTWSPALNNTATTTYTFTPTAGQCATTTTLTINVNSNTTPTFAAVTPICSGATLSALPTTSTNGINGTWSPALNNTATTTYTFTPTVGQCATTTTLTITVNPNITPTFNAVTPICSGATLSALPTTSTNGINGTWSPALNNTATTTYTFTPTAGQCATTTTLSITVNPNITPTFNAVAAICSGGSLSALPTTSTNGISGTWSPALNNTATTTYTFTPTAGQCATTTTLSITVNPNITPTFNAVTPICSGGSLSALPTTSTNGINGTWSPALNNTATTTYTFTPTAGQCATTTTLSITVNPNITPTFNAVTPICSGGSLSALPTTSTNGINGTWSPALNNTTTTTYTFTPTAGQCATTTTLTITVNSNTTPTFAAVAPICSGGSLSALPTTSTNGITGTWSPALDNTATTTYTFTPTAGQCATTTTLTITVNSNITPTFAAVAPICSGATLSALPTTSTNGINGTWSPALNNTATTTYTFTPTAGQCATTTTLTINVNTNTTPTFAAVAPICSGATLSALPTTSTNGINGTWSPALNNTATTTYTFTPTAGQCATTTTLTITVNSNTTPTFAAVAPICSGGSLSALPTTSTNGITGTWSPALDNTATTTYTFTPTAGQCATTTTLTITVNSNTIPTFAAVAPICSGGSLSALPTTSTNGITGTWSPALNNTATTTYTFTPTAGQCATTTTLSITVNPNITPTFNAVTPICSGGSLSALPTTSTNGINGTWSPALNNTATTTYTFTPTAGQCATTTTLTINVNSNITPTFAAVTPICSGATLSALPTTSTNGISGTWSPALNNTATTTYTFTPTAGQCATTTTLSIQVNPRPVVTATVTPISRSICSGEPVTIQLSSSVPGAFFSWTSNSSTVSGHSSSVIGSPATSITQTLTLNPGVTSTGDVTYAIVAESNGCVGKPIYVTIYVNPIPDVIINGDNPLTLCSGNTTAISFDSTFDNTVFNWTVQSSTGVSGAFDGSGTSINQVLTTTGLSAGVVVYEVTPILNGCPGTPKQVTVNVNPIPQLFGSTTQSVVCSGLQPTAISLNSPDPATVYTWIVNQVGVSGATAGTSTGQALSIIQTLTTTDIDVAGYVDYIITPSLNGCPGASVTIRYVVNTIPQVSIEDGVICVDANNITFQTHLIETGLDESVYDFVWFINSVPQANSNSASFIANVVGTYGVQVTNSATNCPSLVAEAVITSTTPATAMTTTVSNAFTDNATIVVTATGGNGTLLYQLNQGAYQESNVFTGVSGGVHEVTVIDSDGCTFLQENVTVIDYPKYFTPNGDGIHDTWNISGLNQVDAKLFIFDRYGKLIKQLIPLDGEIGWDGTYNGEQLPSTDYWFTLDYLENGTGKQFKAHFSLKR